MSDYEPGTIVRHAALALRDFVETLGADGATVDVDGLKISYSKASGSFYLLDGSRRAADLGLTLTDITEWVDAVWMVPA